MYRVSLIYKPSVSYHIDRKLYVERVYEYPDFDPHRSFNSGKLVII